MRMRKSWQEATRDAIRRLCRRTGQREFRLLDLREQELDQIVRDVGSNAKSPARSLEEQVQRLAAMNRAGDRAPELRWVGRGRYQLIGPTWNL